METKKEPLIEVKNLKKYFKVPAGMNHAVDDVSFWIGEGETLGVVGESGCGKSTLGRTIIRLQEATEGEVLLHGKDITHVQGKQLRDVREKCQIIFQDPYSSLNPRKSIRTTIAEPLKHRKLSGAEQKEKAEELMTWTQSVEYEPVYNLGETMMESFARLSRIEALSKQLPGLDCGACGAPSCKALAEDIAKGEAKEEDCVYIMKERIRRLMEQEKGGQM